MRAVPPRPRVPAVLRVGAPLVGALVAVATGGASVLLGRACSAPVPLAASTRPLRATPLAPLRGVTWTPQAFVATGYQTAAPGSPLTVLVQLAGLFGVSGMVSAYNGTAYLMVAATGARVAYDTSTGIAHWSYDGPAGAGPTVQALRSFLDHRWGLVVPATHRARASLAVGVDTMRSQLRVRVAQDGGRITHASGPVFVITTSRDLHVIAPTVALVASGVARAAVAGPPGRVEHAALTWAPYALADATTWLLPAYEVSGTSATGPWTASVLAVASTTVRLP